MAIKFTFSLFVFACVACMAYSAPAQEPTNDSDGAGSQTPYVMDSKTGEGVEFTSLIADLVHSDVIFLGEQHDNDAGHKFQLQVIEGLIDHGVDVVISMEQFERDVQGVVDDYLADRITEEQFLESARPWNNYPEHYRPIIELAKEKRLPVLAGNVPRNLASDVALGRVPNSRDEVFLPRSTSSPENEYWSHFQNSMKGHGGTEDMSKMKKFYASQCLKDDAMAEAITDYISINRHRSKKVVHLCGHFHSDYGLGTSARVVKRLPLTRISVVTMETIQEKPKSKLEDVRARGHYIFWTTKNQPDHAEAASGKDPAKDDSEK